MSIKDEIGSIFGRLTVVRTAPSQNQKAAWLCRCACGQEVAITGDTLRRGGQKSCGCYRRSGDFVRRHGHASYRKGVTQTYKSWQEMRARCSNPHHASFANYGARGISYPEKWERFEQFLMDMGERPPNTSLDRKDNRLGYSRDNCRWATRAIQNNNKRTVALIRYRGRDQSLAQWCADLDLPYSRTYHRIKVQGMSFEDAIRPDKRSTNGRAWT
jgi:hypothetical protein